MDKRNEERAAERAQTPAEVSFRASVFRSVCAHEERERPARMKPVEPFLELTQDWPVWRDHLTMGHGRVSEG